METDQQYRYPGAKPFQTDESFKFYGRNQDTEALYRHVLSEQLTVLHSKSGMGKSSLVNAGLIPHIQKAGEHACQSIRFYAQTDTITKTPIETTRKALTDQSELLDKICLPGDTSLWRALKARQLNHPDRGIILIFDQFEELFTYPPADYHAFAQQLSEALYTTIPQRFSDRLQARMDSNPELFSAEELELLETPIPLHLLFVIRSDRMNLLKKIEDYFPNILKHDYELQALNRRQAEDAILSPAYLKEDFSTPVFDYEDDAIEHLIHFLSDDGRNPIESFQLQILCEYVERELVQKQGKTSVDRNDLSNLGAILEHYYLNKVAAIEDERQRLAARRFIEEGLIFEEEKRRLSVYEGQIYRSYGIDQELLRRLLDTHLLRSEPSLRGGYTYELSHDILVEPVLKAKHKRLEEERIRREREAAEREEQKLMELRQEAEAERKRAQREERLRLRAVENERKTRQRNRLAAVVSVIAVLAATAAFWQYTEAKTAQREAERQTEVAEAAKAEAERNALEAENARDALRAAILEAGKQAGLALDREIDLELALTRIQELRDEYSREPAPPANANVAVANEKMNVLYVGVDNPLSISMSGIPAEQLTVSSASDGLSLTSGENGRYTARVTQPGTASIRIAHPVIGERIVRFRAKAIPQPLPLIGGSIPGGRISAGRLRAQDQLRLLEFFDYDDNCQVARFQVTRTSPGRDPEQLTNLGRAFSPEVKALINGARPGDTYYFDRIDVRCPGDAEVRRLTPLRYEVE